MKKNVLSILLLVAIVALAWFVVFRKPPEKPVNQPLVTKVADPKNAAYTIDGQTITLKDGVSEIPVAGSSSKIITSYFGNEAKADMNGDGVSDVAFLLTQQSGGSGTFYYAAALLSAPSGFVGTNAILLGDRIAPQSTTYANGLLVVNYADRKPSESMSATPTVGMSKNIKAEGTSLREVVVASMTEAQARTIAEKTCIKGGEALSAGTFNENSKTWWFDANLNATRPGCNPACVVSEDSKTAEINWRCTGLLK